MENEKKKSAWGPLETEADARSAIRYGIIAALFTAITTTLVAVWSMGSKQVAFGIIDSWAIIDGIIFFAVAFGIYKGYRFAAISGLLLFTLEKVYQVYVTGQLQGWIVALVIVIFYVQSIRGTFALHRIRNTEAPGQSPTFE